MAAQDGSSNPQWVLVAVPEWGEERCGLAGRGLLEPCRGMSPGRSMPGPGARGAGWVEKQAYRPLASRWHLKPKESTRFPGKV